MNSERARGLQSDLAYSEMVEEILTAIEKGQLKVGQRIAGEPKLKEQYGISVTSVKRGLGVLVERGILRRQRGSGTFVASTDTSPPEPRVRRDTIAIIRNWEYWRYHPFFTERHRGILAGLAKLGWNVLDLQRRSDAAAPANRDTSHLSMSVGVIRREIDEHPEVAGVICVSANDATVDAIGDAGHLVVNTGHGDRHSCIDYDWDAEVERLFRIALAQGARVLGVVSSLEQGGLQDACRRAVGALGLEQKDVELQYLHCKNKGDAPTELTAQAYQLTLKAFRPKTPLIDGLVITEDFEAKGVIDALMQIPHAKWVGIPVVALINKASKLPSRIPMTALVADGYAHGMALAEFIDEKVADGGASIGRMTLSCDQVEWR